MVKMSERNVVLAQYKLFGSCPICGRINRPYTDTTDAIINGHDEHRHRIDDELKEKKR